MLKELSQTDKVLNVLRDGQKHSVPEIIRRAYGLNKPASARLSARVWELRHKRGLTIESDQIKDGKARKSPVWWYQLIPNTAFKKLCK